MNQIVHENSVSVTKLREIYKVAFMRTEIDEDGDLRVLDESGMKVLVSLDDRNNLIKFLTVYRLRKNANTVTKLAFTNKLNDSLVFARFSMAREDILCIDYFLPYTEGVLPFQIVSATKLFMNVVRGATLQHDDDNLIE